MICVALLALTLRPHAGPDISTLNQLAEKRDVAALSAFLDQSPTRRNPFAVLNGGSYDVGSKGWKAEELVTVDGKNLVVFDTPLTSEDTGELVFERAADKLKYIPEDADQGVLITHHSFDLTFDVPTKSARLTDDVTFHRSGEMGSSFLVRFSPCYQVREVKDASGNSVKFQETGGVVSLPTPSGAGDFHYVMRYDAVVDLYQYAGSISENEATLTNDYWYPMICRQPATYDIAVHCPASWTAVAQGELLDTKVEGSSRVTRYRMDLPVTYYSVSAAPYKTHSETVNGRRYSVWSLHMTDQEMKDQCLLYVPVIEFYDKNFGKFPFSGYGAVISDAYGGGALEAYSFATYGGVPGEDGHEPAHTWFGGMCDNTYLHSFWNESFADFCDQFYRRHSPIGEESAEELAFSSQPAYSALWDQGNVEDSGVDAGFVAGALGYGKGAFVLGQLEQEIGTPAMIACLREWIADQPHTRSAEWADFEAAVAKATGKDLSWFWDEWLRRPGVADFDITGVKYEAGAVIGKVTFKGPEYKFKCQVLVKGATGTHLSTVAIDGNGAFSIPCESKPTLVSIDPYLTLVRRMGPDENPLSISRFHSRQVYRDPAQPSYRPELKGNVSKLPENLDGITIVGSPATTPELRSLCVKAGFSVRGETLTYKGTTIDLRHGTATAVLDLEDGGHCQIALGTSRWHPEPGHSSTCVADDLGRFLNGFTKPKLAGNLVFQIR